MRILRSAWLVALAVLPALAQDASIDWKEDYAAGMKEAKESGKLVLLYFHEPG